MGADGSSADGEPLLPLCFVLMPFGVKKDAAGREIDFDRVYREVIRPAVQGAGLECIRADEEKLGGVIHIAMFERLLLCPYAVADLTLANVNVFYELGVRHAARQLSTVLVGAGDSRLPFDVQPLRMVPYHLDDRGAPNVAPADGERIRQALQDAQRQRAPDSPVYQLVDGMQPPALDGVNAAAFQERERRRERHRLAVKQARTDGVGRLREIQAELGPAHAVDPALLVDLLLAYRAWEAYPDMVDLVEAMPPDLAGLTPVREQFALALNRCGQGSRAEDILVRLIDERGPSSETYGLLGRVYKDRWLSTRADAPTPLADALLRKAIETYRAGFDADPRDHYPGVNAVELMYLRDPDDPDLTRLATVVRYSAELAARGRTDYWDCATLLQLAVMDADRTSVAHWLGEALATAPDAMSIRTTADSLARLAAAHPDDAAAWIRDVEAALRSATARR